MFRNKVLWCLTASLTLWTATPVWAHRVNIFAFVDGGQVQVECGFNRSQKVKQGKVEVRDAATGQLVAEGRTDGAGVFRFAVTPAMRQTGHDLHVRIIAGEGHQNEWTVSADELASATVTPPAASSAPSGASAVPTTGVAPASSALPEISATPARGQAANPAPQAPAVSAPSAPPQGLSAAEVERIVNKALDAKLSPIKHMLAAQAEAGPSLKDIIGGIGWIFGLVGVAAYFRRRP